MTKDNCVETNFIIVISGVNLGEYEYIKEDLQAQLKGKSPSPLFVNLPGDYPEIEIVWINGEVEGEDFEDVLKSKSNISVKSVHGRSERIPLVIVDIDGREKRYTRYTQNTWVDDGGYTDEEHTKELEYAFQKFHKQYPFSG